MSMLQQKVEWTAMNGRNSVLTSLGGTVKGAVAPVALAIALASTPKAGNASGAMDPGMIAMLPPYCKYSLTYRQRFGVDDPAKLEYWKKVIGPGFAHIHHYCNGLLQTNLASLRSKDQRERHSALSISIKEFDYVIRNVHKDFVLLPEILSKKGQNLIRLGRGPESIAVMEQAMQLKPDYWPPYAHLADYYVDLGKHEEARRVLEKGLAHSPGAEALTTRLKKLER